MGRTYWYECGNCGYRAKVSGRADRGIHFFVQTIVCRDCKQLYDAVVRVRVPEPKPPLLRQMGRLRQPGLLNHRRPKSPPTFQAALSRLLHPGVKWSDWQQYRAQCPVSSLHRIESWNEPDKCPQCGWFLERAALPFRIWE